VTKKKTKKIKKKEKRDPKKPIATLNAVPDRKNFHVSIAEDKYGGAILIEFTEDGTEFKGTHDGKVFCVFQSAQGPVGIHGGTFRVSSGERRNFVLGVVSLVIILQKDALVGSQTKGIGIKFEDTGQKPRKNNEEKVADTKATTPTLSPRSAGGKLEAAGGNSPPSLTLDIKTGSQQTVSSRGKKVVRKAATHSGPRGSSSEKVSSPRKTKGHDRNSPKHAIPEKTPNAKTSNEKKPSEEPSRKVSRRKSDHSVKKKHKHSDSSTSENSSVKKNRERKNRRESSANDNDLCTYIWTYG